MAAPRGARGAFSAIPPRVRAACPPSGDPPIIRVHASASRPALPRVAAIHTLDIRPHPTHPSAGRAQCPPWVATTHTHAHTQAAKRGLTIDSAARRLRMRLTCD